MQYAVLGSHEPADVDRFRSALLDIDPAALVDQPPVGGIRISTVLRLGELRDCLDRAGIAIRSHQLASMPSECCGGCGG